jgi:hypothetical protein
LVGGLLATDYFSPHFHRAIDIADEFPRAEVIAVDLAPIQPEYVKLPINVHSVNLCSLHTGTYLLIARMHAIISRRPSSLFLTQNYRFELCDLDQWPIPYPDAYFDFIHARSIHIGVCLLSFFGIISLYSGSRFTIILNFYTNWLVSYVQVV